MKKMCFCPVALAAALLVALFFASCSNEADNSAALLLLKGGLGKSEILQTKHVKVEKVTGGLKFTIKRPTADGYQVKYDGSGNVVSSGWSSVFITTTGNLSKGRVQATVDLSGTVGKDEVTVFWPICEPGKLCEYGVQIEPYDGRLRESIIQEKLVVAANEGSVKIEKAPKHSEVILSYDGQKPTVKAEGLESPAGKIQNLKTKCHFFATNQSQLKDGSVDWRTDYAVSWICEYSVPGVVDEFVWDDAKYWDSRTFNEIFDATGKDTLYTTWTIQFDLPELSGLDVWVFVLDGKKNLLKIR